MRTNKEMEANAALVVGGSESLFLPCQLNIEISSHSSKKGVYNEKDFTDFFIRVFGEIPRLYSKSLHLHRFYNG